MNLVRRIVPIVGRVHRPHPVIKLNDTRQIRFTAIHTFQAMKLTASTIVGWMISLPGKTPHVTALGPSERVLVLKSPRLLMT